MIRFKALVGNEFAVIENGIVYEFDSGGKIKAENCGLSAKYTSNLQEGEIISILSSRGYTEIYLVKNDDTTLTYEANCDSMKCVSTLFERGTFIRMLRRDGKKDTIRYNQMVFIYPKGTNIEDLIRDLKK